jgi:hypothetical protein
VCNNIIKYPSQRWQLVSHHPRGITCLQITHALHGTYVHNHLDDIAYAYPPISVHEMCARGGRCTVRRRCSRSSTASFMTAKRRGMYCRAETSGHRMCSGVSVQGLAEQCGQSGRQCDVISLRTSHIDRNSPNFTDIPIVRRHSSRKAICRCS